MSSGNRQPFIDSRAFDKASSTYVPFPSQADAMLASLQLFHNVPCRIMDLIFSVVTHPEFDSKQLNLRSSVDVIDVVEESRLKDRMAVVQVRSASRDGRVKQAGFPQFILDEVLDIIHAERMDSIKARFEETLDERAMYFDSMHIEEDDTLKAMTRVHRSWTILAQKALGRVLHIGRPTDEMDILLSPVRKSIFGPWTSAVAVQFYHPITETTVKSEYCSDEYTTYDYCTDVLDEYRDWFDNLHRILVGFTNLKCLYMKSYASFFTSWSGLTFAEMVRRNVRLEEVALYAMPESDAFHFDPLIENAAVLNNLRTLNIRGALMSDVLQEKTTRGVDFAGLKNVTIRRSFLSITDDLSLLSIFSSPSNSHLESLRIIDTHGRSDSFEEEAARTFTSSQSAAIFGRLRELLIDSHDSAQQWFELIGPYCSSLDSLSIIDNSCRRDEESVARAFTTSQNAAVFDKLRSLHIDSKREANLWFKWIGPYCAKLESLSIIDHGYGRQLFEEHVGRGSSFPQSVIFFHRLCTLRIGCKEQADLWLKWICPYCSGLQSLTLDTNVSLTPDTLDLIPIAIRSLDVSLSTTWTRTLDEITGWMKWLLKIASSMQFSELKSLTLFISQHHVKVLSYEQREQRVRTMQNFREKMSAVCEGVGVECYLNL